MFSRRMRYFNKYVLNRLTSRLARSAHGPFAIVGHVGRHSGRTYETPIIVIPAGESFVIALTYGSDVDWYRNLLATGQGTLLWHKKTYSIGKPEAMEREAALPHFSPLERTILRLFNTQHFVQVKPC